MNKLRQHIVSPIPTIWIQVYLETAWLFQKLILFKVELGKSVEFAKGLSYRKADMEFVTNLRLATYLHIYLPKNIITKVTAM